VSTASEFSCCDIILNSSRALEYLLLLLLLFLLLAIE